VTKLTCGFPENSSNKTTAEVDGMLYEFPLDAGSAGGKGLTIGT